MTTWSQTLSFAGILALPVVSGSAQSEIGLNRGWRFHKGDDATWSNTNFDDADWQAIQTGKSWERQGHADHDGFAWYRISVTIHARIQQTEAFQATKRLLVNLGHIDDCDQAWLNGQAIGQTGSMPPSYQSEFQKERKYVMPPAAIRWDANNVIAVRVYDGAGRGGMYRGRPAIRPAAIGELIKLRWNQQPTAFDNAKEFRCALTLRNQSPNLLKVQGSFRLLNDLGKEIDSSNHPLEIGAGQSVPITYSEPPTTPGFYKIAFRAHSNEIGVVHAPENVFAYRAKDISSPLTQPTDFDDFWRKTRAELDAVDANFEVVRHASRDSNTHEVHEVIMHSLGQVRVRAWYEKPKQKTSDTPTPAVLVLPGYAQAMQPTGRSNPVAILSLNPRGHGTSTDDEPGLPHNFWVRHLDDPQTYYYRGAYMDCVRAIDFLVTQKEVDASRIMVTGGSQGGGLSLATAALDQRVALCAPDIAWLCDFERYLQFETDTPDYDSWLASGEGRSAEVALATLHYFDTLNLVDQITCPTFASIGMIDDVCPPATTYAAFARISAPKVMHFYPGVSHSVTGEHRAKKWQWMAKQFGIKSR